MAILKCACSEHFFFIKQNKNSFVLLIFFQGLLAYLHIEFRNNRKTHDTLTKDYFRDI